MNIKTPLAGALALLAFAVPAVAAAQERVYVPPSEPRYVPAPSVTPLTLVPPAYTSIFVYEGHRLLARLDGPGVLWVPTGPIYRVVAMRGDQVIWSGDRAAGGTPVDIRWPYDPRTPCPFPYPRGPLTAPIERGRVRTPNP